MIKRILLLALIVGLSGLWACAGRSTTAQDRDAGVPTADEYISDYDELQTLLSGDNETRMRRTADAIFQLEPGQPSALRLRCFVLESSNRAPEALDI
ncbi:MAG: hypothetical protein EOM25_12705 [Deltaproteobacteria bacterium]|nr:hypothetical protein [Deltaproteobacteria bacterium]